MITNFSDFTGVIKIDGQLFHLKYDEEKQPFEVRLYLHSGKYEELSIIVPDSDNLGHKEFFLNPTVDKKIVDSLESENFIQSTGKTTMAGDKKTKSYTLLV